MLHPVTLGTAPQKVATRRRAAPLLAEYPHLQAARIALVHDYLFEQGGAENVVEALAGMLPQAPLYTSIYDPGSVSFAFASHEVHTSFLQHICRQKQRAKALLPLYPLAFRSLDLTGFDLVLSSSSGFALGAHPSVGARHVCYCHSPAHFIWDLHEYVQSRGSGQVPVALVAAPFVPLLKAWDVHAAHQVQHFVANSAHTAARVAHLYGRRAHVIPPPIRLRDWHLADTIGEYYLIVSRLLPYKRIDLAIQACNELRAPLRIVGDGPDRTRLQRLAGPTITFEGRIPRHVLARRYATCRAVILPGNEDLGITALEAQASGRPVIVYAASGAAETIIEGVTGTVFHEQSADALADRLRSLDVAAFEPQAARAHAAEFDIAHFRQRMLSLLENVLVANQVLPAADNVPLAAPVSRVSAACPPALPSAVAMHPVAPTVAPRRAHPKKPPPWESASKAIFDRVVATLALVMVSPLLTIAALAILISDGPPVFYRPRRTGQNGHEFALFKLRTMTRDAEQRLSQVAHLNRGGRHMIRIPHDPRVTPVGRVLRRLALDELPQLLNVLRGDMSLVGPRPQSPAEVALYTPYERQRLRPLPGITGLWQVSARHETDFARWVALDLEYLETWSFWLDLKIILRTPLAIFRGTDT